MPIKFEHHGKMFEVETPEQACWLMDLLDARVAAQTQLVETSKRLRELGFLKPASEVPKRLWNPALFERYIRRLGEPQKNVLEYLLLRGLSADWELRYAIGVSDNQALAGVLSGLSKQALAEKLSPRDVFVVQNFRSGGKRGSRYALSEVFRDIAREMNWPAELHKELYPELNLVDAPPHTKES